MTNTYPKKPGAGDVFLNAYLADVSTAGQIYVAPGFSGRIKSCSVVINGAIGTADVDFTLKIGGTAVTGGVITIPYTSSAAGDVGSCEPTALNNFSSAQVIEIETDGASTNTVAAMVTLQLETV